MTTDTKQRYVCGPNLYISGLVYQKTIYGCHHCPNAKLTKNGKNKVCTKDISWRFIGKYIQDSCWPGWCPIFTRMKNELCHVQLAVRQNWEI